jgi:broad specificity phosphatase PhoE
VSVDVVFETHSTSTDNEAGIATGWHEGTLSETGREQARLLGERRRDDGIDQVICSDLRRAVETAEIAFAGTAIPIRYDERLRECNYGSLNGMPRALLDAERAQHLDQPWPQGESWRQAVARVTECLVELPAAYPGKRVVVIGHVATRWALDHHANDVALEALVDEDFAWREGWEYTLTD